VEHGPEGYSRTPDARRTLGTVHSRLGSIYVEYGRIEEAVRHFREAVRLGRKEALKDLKRTLKLPRGMDSRAGPLPLTPWVATDMIVYGSSEIGATWFKQAEDPAAVAVAELLLWEITLRPARAGPVLRALPDLLESRRWDLALAVATHGRPAALRHLGENISRLAFAPIPGANRRAELHSRIIRRLAHFNSPEADRALARYLLSEEAWLREESQRALAPRLRGSARRLAVLLLACVAEMIEENRGASDARRTVVYDRINFGLSSLEDLVRRPPPATGGPEPTAEVGVGAVRLLAPEAGIVIAVEDLPLLIRVARALEADASRSISCRTAYVRSRRMMWERIGPSRREGAFRALLYLARPFDLARTLPAPRSSPEPSGEPTLLPRRPLRLPLPTDMQSLLVPGPRDGLRPDASPKLVPVPEPTPGSRIIAPFTREARRLLRLRSPSAWGVELAEEEEKLMRGIRSGRLK